MPLGLAGPERLVGFVSYVRQREAESVRQINY